ncbi:MAG: tryptophan synthase subunit alpha [Gemmatimonadales bacterium]
MVQGACSGGPSRRAPLPACWRAIAAIRAEHPALPIGLLVYANLVIRPGLERFYRAAAAAGVDSVLVADAPLEEAAPFERAASDHSVAPVLVAPPNADDARLAAIAARGRGYTYLAARRGVTGDDRREAERLAERVARLRALGAPPPIVGFGIGRSDQVRAALAAGAAGVIAGSALVRRLADGRPGALERAVELAANLKAATRPIAAPG